MSATELEDFGGVPIVHVAGDIDAATVGAVRAQLEGTLGPDAFSLIVDLARTGYIDSTGLDMLLRLSDRLAHRRARLMLVIPPESQLTRLVRLVGLDRAVAVYATVDEALRLAAELPRSTGAPEPG